MSLYGIHAKKTTLNKTSRFDFNNWFINFPIIVFCSNHSSKKHHFWAKDMGGWRGQAIGRDQCFEFPLTPLVGWWEGHLTTYPQMFSSRTRGWWKPRGDRNGC